MDDEQAFEAAVWYWFGDECLNCGCDGYVSSEGGTPTGQAKDGTAAKCLACGMPGQVVVDEDGAEIVWHDEPPGACDCEWCRVNKATETNHSNDRG